MAKVELKRVNNEEDGYTICLEVDTELVLGRGPLLQIDHPGISRRLANFVWRGDEERLELVSLHKTPIRVYSCGSDKWSSIARDTALACLEVLEGDTVELTKSFAFRVTSITSKVMNEMDSRDENLDQSTNLENQDPKEEVIKPLPTGVMGLKKKRKLPEWMKANQSSPEKAALAPSGSNQRYLENVKLITSSPMWEHDIEESKRNRVEKVKTTSKSPFEISDDDEDGASVVAGRVSTGTSGATKERVKVEMPEVRKCPFEYVDEEGKIPVGSSCLKLSEYAEYINLLGNPPAEGKGRNSSTSLKEVGCLEQESVEEEKNLSPTSQEDHFTFPVLITQEDVHDEGVEEEAGTSKMKTVATAKRPPCAFGAACYRKNPAHRKDTAHPGDHDFKDTTDQDNERPECEYGLECYRKNPQHRMDFKHSVRPLPSRKAKEATQKKVKSKEADEYESDFIDDEEDGWEPIDDSDDDADWAPQGSQEEEDDDTQELKVNANKRKKVFDDESEVESIGADIDEYSSP